MAFGQGTRSGWWFNRTLPEYQLFGLVLVTTSGTDLELPGNAESIRYVGPEKGGQGVGETEVTTPPAPEVTIEK